MKSNNLPLVSISIPTYNSEKYIKSCLDAIVDQSYKNYEVIIIDGGSSDNTVNIAKEYEVDKIILNTSSLLSARRDGVLSSKGKYTFLLDSDQIVGKNTIRKCLDVIIDEKLNMLILEEKVYSKNNLLEKLYHLDKELVHGLKDTDPHTSVLLPRFFRREFLLRAFRNIPEKSIKDAWPQDHAIIYLESWKLDARVKIIPNCIRHIEPSSFRVFCRKFYRWGYYSNYQKDPLYQDFFIKKTMRMRKGIMQNLTNKNGLASVVLLIMKGILYKIGYYTAKMKGEINNRFPDR